MRPADIAARIASQWFSLAMAALGLLAWWAPDWGSLMNPGGGLRRGAIMLIFLLTGLTLPTERVLRGLVRWRAHVFIQCFAFVVMPACAWLALWPWRDAIEPGLLAGFLLLAVLPITISSSVVFTQLAGGAVEVALFNAIAGNLVGVIVSPLLLVLLLGGGTAVEIPLGPVMMKIGLLVLLPFALGQAFHWMSRGATARWKFVTARINSSAILLIVYLAFCAAFASNLFARLGTTSWLSLLMLVPAHALVLLMVDFGARRVGLDRGDRIAALFCAPQKTLALGLPLAVACFEHRPELIGAASLPIMVYHTVQLIAAGWLKGRLAPA